MTDAGPHRLTGRAGPAVVHLQPVLDAEQDLGNSTRDGFRYIPQNGGWFAFMRRPLNIEGLRAAFEFPEHITCGRQDNGDTWLVDTANDVRIDAVNPHRRLGPPRPPRTGLPRRLFGP
jgi:hypothetical protein